MGTRHLELAEESVQDALVAALQSWPWAGIPDDPEAWLARTARNRAIDRLRRRAKWESELPAEELARRVEELAAPRGDDPLRDDELSMLFLCNHPSLPAEGAIALTLVTVGGLSTREVARAFLVPPATMSQRVVRAKRAFRALEEPVRLPDDPGEIAVRRERVLKSLYLMFSEGYATTEGENRVRAELCGEAIRLGELLARHPATTGPEVDAHLALFLLQSSRLPARTGPEGELLPLDRQDRERWDRGRISRGLLHLDRARGDRWTPVHVEAGIAAEHAVAPRFEDTNWDRIVTFYDQLSERAASPVVTLNRAVAVGMRDGPEAGLALLRDGSAGDGPDRDASGDVTARDTAGAVGEERAATRAFLLERAGRVDAARAAWREAAERARSAAAARYYRSRA